MIVAAVSLGCPSERSALGNDPATLAYLEQALWTPSQGGRTVCAYEAMGEDAATMAIFVWAVCEERIGAKTFGGRSGPVVLVFGPDRAVRSHKEPRDGAAYASDLRRLFPDEVRAKFENQGGSVHRARVDRLLASLHTRAQSIVVR